MAPHLTRQTTAVWPSETSDGEVLRAEATQARTHKLTGEDFSSREKHTRTQRTTYRVGECGLHLVVERSVREAVGLVVFVVHEPAAAALLRRRQPLPCVLHDKDAKETIMGVTRDVTFRGGEVENAQNSQSCIGPSRLCHVVLWGKDRPTTSVSWGFSACWSDCPFPDFSKNKATFDTTVLQNQSRTVAT